MDYRETSLINLAQYPIDCDSPARDSILEQVREELLRDGCAVLKGFLTPQGIDALRQEADSVAQRDTDPLAERTPISRKTIQPCP